MEAQVFRVTAVDRTRSVAVSKQDTFIPMSCVG